jgi:hypothetical protein
MSDQAQPSNITDNAAKEETVSAETAAAPAAASEAAPVEKAPEEQESAQENKDEAKDASVDKDEATTEQQESTKDAADDKPAEPESAAPVKPAKSSNGKTPRGSGSNKKSAANDDDSGTYAEGDFILAKVAGYPWWPGMVVTHDHLPPAAQAAKPATKGRKDGTTAAVYPVQFFGQAEYSWVKPADLKPLSKDEASSFLNSSKKATSKAIRAAYQVVLDNPTLESLLEAKNSIPSAQFEDEDEEMADEDDEDAVVEDDDDEGPKKSKTAKKAATPRTKTPKSTAPKRRKSEAADGESSAKKAKTPVVKKAKVTKPSERDASPELSPEEEEKRKWQARKQQIMFLRHKLQKILLGKEAPAESEVDPVPGYLNDLSLCELDIEIFRETKIGKVLSRICKLENIPKDEKLGIKSKSREILEKWKGKDLMSEEKKESAAGAQTEAKPTTATTESGAEEKTGQIDKTTNGTAAEPAKQEENKGEADAPAAQESATKDVQMEQPQREADKPAEGATAAAGEAKD